MATIDTGLRFCPRCGVEHPLAACRTTRLGDEFVPLCPTCGMVTRGVTTIVRAPLLAVYATALRYPLQPDAAIALVALAIGVWLVSFIPLIGGLAATGLTLMYLFNVIRHTASGHDDLPHAADFTEWSDLLKPTFRFLLAMVVALGPSVAAAVALHGSAAMVPALVLTGAWFVAYLPGAVAVASLQEGCLGGANPLPVIELARRVPREYGLTVATLLALAVPAILLRALVVAVVPAIPLVGTILGIAGLAVSLVVPMVMTRVLGLLLRERADEIGLGG